MLRCAGDNKRRTLNQNFRAHLVSSNQINTFENKKSLEMGPKTSDKCGICHDNDAKYKCPKCEIKYCSLTCYKDETKHQDPVNSIDQKEERKKKDENLTEPTGLPQLASTEYSKIYSENPEIRELLKYNTVKFHLSKVYRILCSNVADSNESNMNSETKRQLAVDYLNTLRYGGIHYNEAIEEFCQLSLSKLNNSDDSNA